MHQFRTHTPYPFERPIFLIGFMGSGKSTLGPLAARQLGRFFTDLDQSIEQETGFTVANLFDRLGEKGFRRVERSVLVKIMEKHRRHLIACGGGTPCFEDNMAMMNQRGLTVYLDVTAQTLAQRLEGQSAARPILQKLSGAALHQQIESLLLQRQPFYKQAKLVLRGDSLSASELHQAILQHAETESLTEIWEQD